MAGLWDDLARTLTRLDSIASRPAEELEDEAVLDSLSVLQYSLHVAGELALGVDPPADAEWAHHELAGALADARDATADVAEAAWEGGPPSAAPLVPEWRGALFRVRLAQMRLVQIPPVRKATEVPLAHDRAALMATALVLAGTFTITCGAVLGVWELWAVGLALVASSFIAYRP